MNRVELLAPAGDLKRCKVAIRYGADAVYIGGKRFSLRSRASNFDLDNIAKACAFAKDYNAKIFVTVNMIPHDEDIIELDEYLIDLEKAGVSAIIVASPYIIERCKALTNMEVHISTQINTTNSLSIKEFEESGADRVVVARECDINQIKMITDHTDMPIEVFIHGGMCSNFSGRCTLSNAMTLRDANRGGCAQSCRWKYHLLENDEVISDDDDLFSMSSTDLVATNYIQDMINANVASLKIEGRMKSEYYIATVVKTYRDLIDEIYENKEKKLSDDRLNYYAKEIAKAENRPTNDGFLNGLPTKNHHLYGINGAGVTHEFVAYVKEYDPINKLALIESRNYFKLNDELEVFGPNIKNTKFKLLEMYDIDHNIIEISNQPMRKLYIKIDFEVYKHDMIRKV